MRKLIYCIADGMADDPALCADAITPLQAAHTPNMNSMARHSVAGLCHVIPEGCLPDSDVGNMALLGYAPQECHAGRASFEALGRGVKLGRDDVAWRLSLVVQEDAGADTVMRDAQGGGVSTVEGRLVVERLRAVLSDISGDLALYEDDAYRHILVHRGGAALAETHTVGPHMLLGCSLTEHSDRYPALLRTAMEACAAELRILAVPPNGVWLWGQGRAPLWQEFAALHGLEACMVSGLSLLRGMARAAGLHVVEDARFTGLPGTDLGAKADAAIQFLRQGGDVAFIHVDAPDHCAHHGDFAAKAAALSAFDRELLGPLMAAEPGAVIVVTCDHVTAVSQRTHRPGPVPFMIYRKGLVYPATAANPSNPSNPGDPGGFSFTETGVCGLGEVPSGPELLALAKCFL